MRASILSSVHSTKRYKKMSKTLPLKIDSIAKAFKKKQVLYDVSLDIKPGEIFGLIGLNGVGKTTLIKIILDLLEQDQGEVKLFGDSSAKPKTRKQLAYLPEKFHPSPFLKGEEFLHLSQTYYQKPLTNKEIYELADRLGLDQKALGQPIRKYSKGMGQKLGLLSIFLSQAPLLLLDEPMSGLDPKARIQLKDMLLEYKKQGNTIFFSSHILADIEEICDQIAIIHDTHVVYQGSPKKFLKQQKEKHLERAFLRAVES